MNRKIKFRLIKDNEVVGYEVHKQSDDDIDRMIVEHQHPDGLAVFIHKFPEDYIKHDRKEIYVGIHDSNSNEIYNGDIISYREFDKDSFAEVQKKGVINFSQPYKGAVIEWVGEGSDKLQSIRKKSLEFTTNILVIGNKSENPNLIDP